MSTGTKDSYVCAIFKHWGPESKIFYRLNTLYSPSAHSLPFKDTKLSIQILTSIYDAEYLWGKND